MNFCSNCGSPTRQRKPLGDNKNRDVCIKCGSIFYQNPKIIAGCVPTFDNKVLLCKRAIEPRSGFWTLPAGFMEIGESTSEGAKRETIEESGADIELKELFAVFDIPTFNQVHIFYLARMKSDKLNPGIESLEARLFREEDIPWPELSFTSVKKALELFYEKSSRNLSRVHTALIN